MSRERSPGAGRRSFLRATGAVGASATLAATVVADDEYDGYGAGGDGDDGDGREPSPPLSRADYPDETVIGVTRPEAFDDVVAALPEGSEVVERDPDLQYLRVRLPDRDSTYARMRDQSTVASHEAVKMTQANRPIRVVQSTTDPELVDPADLPEPDDPRYGPQYAIDQVNAPDAWEALEDPADVTVGVVDTGIQYDHRDLRAQFGEDKGMDAVGVLGGEDDANDPYPVNVRNEYHGTHVGGIVAATRDNDEGVAGTADAQLLSCRMIASNGSLTLPTDISQAIKGAVDRGADVLNMSIGTPVHFFFVKRALEYALDQGVVPVASAGNHGELISHAPDFAKGVAGMLEDQTRLLYPAKWDFCLGVSAVNDREEMWEYSKYGDEVDVTAPGENVLSTLPEEMGSGYGRLSGTSMSSPIVAGVAALVKARHPDFSPAEVRRRIKDTARDIGLSDRRQGAGQVDAYAAVTGERLAEDNDRDDDGVPDGEDDDVDGDGVANDGDNCLYTANAGQADADGDGVGDRCDPAEDGQVNREEGLVETVFGGLLDAASPDDAQATYDYDPFSDDPDSLTLDLSHDPDADLDLFVALDGRTPSVSDYDLRARTPTAGESLELPAANVDPEEGVSVLVDAYDGRGTYELTVTERGEDVGGPSVAAPGVAPPGSRVTFAGSAELVWEFDDGTVREGRTVDHAFDRPGDHEVRAVLDRGDREVAVRRTVTVDPGARVGHRRFRDAAAGEGTGRFRYEPRAEDSLVAVSLESPGPAGADLDVFVTHDGRPPTPEDFDARSVTPGTDGRVLVEGADADGPIGVLVRHVDGDPRFRLLTEEVGTGV